MTIPAPTGLTLGQRLLIAQVCVLAAMAATIIITAALIGPSTFHTHMKMATGVHDANVVAHAEMGFRDAGLLSLLVGLGIALVGAMVVNLVILRRVHTDLLAMSVVARRVAAGEYDIHVDSSRTGSEITSLAGSLNHLSSRLLTTEQTRRRMLTDLAHEMRTPLTAVDMTLEAIEDGIATPDADTLAAMRQHTARLTRLVSDIRDVSAAQEGRLTLVRHPASVTDMVESAHALVAADYATKGVTLNVHHHDATVDADPDRIEQILLNLLTNALRHTPTGGSVVITCSVSEGDAVIAVADTGTGIAPEHLPHLFERFYRADTARTRAHGGTGVGLSISEALARAHGGTLDAHSLGIGFGATFTLRLPVA